MIGLRGAVAPEAGLFARAAREICEILRAEGVADMPIGVDIVEPPMLAALEAEGIIVRDGQQVMLDAREVKSIDEIMLLNTACAMVDGAYQMIAEQLKPGVRESELVANVTKFLFELGSEHVDNINAVSGERCSPHPHVFSDRIIRPGDQAFFDIIHTFVGYKTCYYRTFVVGKATDAQRDAYKQAREWIDASIELMRPGRRHGPGRRASGRRPRSSASAARWSASASSSATASACSSTSGRSSAASTRSTTRSSSRRAWSSPSRPTARRRTATPRRGSRRRSSITADGPQVITRFPSQELFVANAY